MFVTNSWPTELKLKVPTIKALILKDQLFCLYLLCEYLFHKCIYLSNIEHIALVCHKMKRGFSDTAD